MKRLAVVLVAVTVIVSGCVDALDDEEAPEEPEIEEEPQPTDEETIDDEETTDEVREIRIAGGSYYYEPENIEVEEGETVEFVFENEGGTHDLVLEDSQGNDVANTAQIGTGETDSFTYTFEEDEDYEFYCSVSAHRAQGMEGTVTVE